MNRGLFEESVADELPIGVVKKDVWRLIKIGVIIIQSLVSEVSIAFGIQIHVLLVYCHAQLEVFEV